jgi:hypothetical protein
MTNEKELKIQITIDDDCSPTIEFKDAEEKECFILKSTFKNKAVCFGQNDSNQKAIFIEQNMLKVLMPYLKKFADTGELI